MPLTGSRTPCVCMFGDVSLYTTQMPFYLILSGHGESNISFFTASTNSLALLPLLCLSAPPCPSHSFMAENSSLTFSNKKHTLQVSSRGHLRASVIGQTRSLTFFRRSLLLTGWDTTFFLFREEQPPQMFTTPSSPLWLPLFFSQFDAKHAYLDINLSGYLKLSFQNMVFNST